MIVILFYIAVVIPKITTIIRTFFKNKSEIKILLMRSFLLFPFAESSREDEFL